MGGIRGLIGWVFVGVVACVCLLLAAPAGGAASLGSGQQPPPVGDPPPPTLTLVPAAVSADALVKVVGEGFATCVAANGEVTSSRNGDASVAATGDVSLFWDGIDPVASIHMDEEFGFTANLETADSTSPGDHRLVSRCVDDEGDAEEGVGSADFTVTPPPEVMAVVPGINTVDDTTPSPATSAVDAVDAALAAPDNPDGASTADNPSAPSDALPLAENEGTRVIGAEPALPGTDPLAWGLLVGALILVGAVLAVPLLIPFILQARRGPKWVRANVRAVAHVAPPMSVALAPQIGDCWPPTSVVRFALHADSGTQVLTEVKQ